MSIIHVDKNPSISEEEDSQSADSNVSKKSSNTIQTEFSGSDANISEIEREQELKNIKKNPRFTQANRMYGCLHRQQVEIERRRERKRTYDKAMK